MAIWPRGFYRNGLAFVPMQLEGTSESYSSTVAAPKAGQPCSFRVAVSHHTDMARFISAWNGDDHRGIADLLGYPDCCYRFFHRFWINEGFRDTTWPAAVATVTETRRLSNCIVETKCQPELNLLGRWLGVRAIPHLPCAFDCAASLTLARKLLELGREGGFSEEIDWLRQILRWPAEWSAVHGIAEIKLPIARISAATEATSMRYVVRRLGDLYPDEGADGVSFPFRRPKTNIVQDHISIGEPQ
jgi:hypothetical protein